MRGSSELPLVYACSGASSAAQMANHIAVKLDRLKVAEISSIAGWGGDVNSLVRIAKSSRPIIALDGCSLHCVARILQRHSLRADKHYDLSALGVKKRLHEDFNPEEAGRVLRRIMQDSGFPGGPEPPAAATAAPDGKTASLPPSSASNLHDETAECASPPCYISELEKMKGVAL